MTRAQAHVISVPVRQMVLIGAVMAFAALLTGCNTVEGAGQDIKAGGRAVERAAE